MSWRVFPFNSIFITCLRYELFQAELYAIRKACELLPEIKRAHENDPDFDKIRILSDSQAALQALGNIDTSSKLVEETKIRARLDQGPR